MAAIDPGQATPQLGRITLPSALPLSALFAVFSLVIAATMGWRDLHSRSDSLSAAIEIIRAEHTRFSAESKATDAEVRAAITMMREQSASRQEALLTRLARIETILERLERQNTPEPAPRPSR